ncbi:exopolysaccharide biosynthesis polyprenyl glycosylphosphotransferase [Neolewinella antarctica]|uniref:Undecaprenyl-phosphate glucose phosphotransferase n=1 Tax=Neolewinella antarctica TaxID=442734 RepID=A0ABX0XBU5_9BACT|nr:exopolysaccharide biosynthesis polyprenyl glycosylphosphotransferase [Neolewinella antarctica]NJC26667.1 Undecaprenyl-phosphate glucose phosphotransferase [Neolewinella antarctica]
MPQIQSYQRRLRRSPHRYDLIVTDFLLINVGFYIAAKIVYPSIDVPDVGFRQLELVVFVNVIWAALGFYYEAYRWYEKIRMEVQLRRLLEMFLFHAALFTLFYYYVLGDPPTTLFITLAYSLSIMLVAVGRIYRRTRETGDSGRFRYVIVGGRPPQFSALFTAFDYSFQGNARLVGRFGKTTYKNVTNIGKYVDLIPFLKGQPDIDKLILFYSDLSVEEGREIMRLCQNQYIDVEIAPRQTTIFPRGYKAQRHGEMVIFTIKEEPLVMLRNKVVKRTFDIVFSGMVLIFLYPIMYVVIGILIKLESKGPVIFEQERTGYRNGVFMVKKFRSMGVNAASDTRQATKGDMRVTRIGAFLRRTSLDEFPQFINVFKGQMSVVGPRPHMVAHTQQYAELIRPYLIRHKVKPGVTGWAQVNGFRGPTEELWKMEKRVEHDVWYLENWSLLLDIRCIYNTIVNIAEGEEEGAL